MRRRRWGATTIAAVTVAGLLFGPAGARADRTTPSPLVCDGPVDELDPVADQAEWIARDLQNIACATQRQQDELTNPAYLLTMLAENAEQAGELPELVLDQLAEPTRPHIGPVWPAFPARVTDPFRDADNWQAAGRGQFQELTFVASTGAHLLAKVFSPNPQPGEGRLPALAFSPGLLSYNEVNVWFPEDLAEAGYIVLIIDPQGQGRSENLPHRPDGSIDCDESGCPNVPTDYVPEMQSAIDFLLSTPADPYTHAVGANSEGTARFNPQWARVDPDRIGVAGHSLGAITVTRVGQLDQRVKAVVSFDGLNRRFPADVVPSLHAPMLFLGADYEFPSVLAPMDPSNPPDPSGHFGALGELAAVGIDAMSITSRASTHYEWSYQPFPASLQASRYGERLSSYFTIAWFDRYVKGDHSATIRLVAERFDDSADVHSIGSGTYDANAALADPTEPRAGNVPYAIAGKCVANLLSFYFDSGYWLEGGTLESNDMAARRC